MTQLKPIKYAEDVSGVTNKTTMNKENVKLRFKNIVEPKFIDYVEDMISKAEADAKESEKELWLSGQRCMSCGVEKEADLADWCGKCLEEN